MYAAYPVYYPSSRYAIKNGEQDLWRQSHSINQECRDFLSGHASIAYHGHALPQFIYSLVENFGLERSMYVIARTIVGAGYDGRYYKDAVERAALFDFQEMREAKTLREEGKDPYNTADKSAYYCSDVHPVMLNDIFRFMMKLEQELLELPQSDEAEENEYDEGVEQ